MPDRITFEQLLMLAQFVLPGTLSMYVYGLKVPQKEFQLKDRIAEAIFFSMLNFVVVGPIVSQFPGIPLDPAKVDAWGWMSRIAAYLVVVAAFVVMPVVWVFAVVGLRRLAVNRGWITAQPPSAWDGFFAARKGCWMTLTLADGSVVGGKYGTASFATTYPDSGHLYLEEMWEVNAQGTYVRMLIPRRGIILRPTDYKFVYVD
jgi:hypothetical protein